MHLGIQSRATKNRDTEKDHTIYLSSHLYVQHIQNLHSWFKPADIV